MDSVQNLAKTLQIKTLWKRKNPPLMVGFTNIFCSGDTGGDKKNSLKQLDFISNIRYGYDEFYEVFLCIVRYHLNINKKLQLSNYNELSRKLNYPILNESFLINYF